MQWGEENEVRRTQAEANLGRASARRVARFTPLNHPWIGCPSAGRTSSRIGLKRHESAFESKKVRFRGIRPPNQEVVREAVLRNYPDRSAARSRRAKPPLWLDFVTSSRGGVAAIAIRELLVEEGNHVTVS
jgi:hypothetical protein